MLQAEKMMEGQFLRQRECGEFQVQIGSQCGWKGDNKGERVCQRLTNFSVKDRIITV